MEFPRLGFTCDEWAKAKTEILDYEFECENAVDIVKPDRMQDISDTLSLINEIVIPDGTIEIEITHAEKDLRFWQIRIRGISFMIPKSKIEFLKTAIRKADEVECMPTYDNKIEIVIGFNDCANRYVKM